MVKYVDVVQIGARNMQNFELLKCVGRIGKPVLLKRGLAATIEEWLMSAEYILSEGNDQVILCERGIRTFERYTRNTLDLTAVPVIKALTHLPIIIDPSHATGIREKVSPMARAAIAAGADGLILEVHTEPDKALSDGPQSLYPEQFKQLMRDLHVIAPVVGKQLDFNYLEKAKKMGKTRGSGHAAHESGLSRSPGSFSHKACVQFFGTEVPHESCSSFRKVFEAVQNGDATLGIVPLENSFTGSIHENYDLLLENDLHIVGRTDLEDRAQPRRSSGHASRWDQTGLFAPAGVSAVQGVSERIPRLGSGGLSGHRTAVLRVKENNDRRRPPSRAERLLNSMACPCCRKELKPIPGISPASWSFLPVSSSTAPRTNLP